MLTGTVNFGGTSVLPGTDYHHGGFTSKDSVPYHLNYQHHHPNENKPTFSGLFFDQLPSKELTDGGKPVASALATLTASLLEASAGNQTFGAYSRDSPSPELPPNRYSESADPGFTSPSASSSSTTTAVQKNMVQCAGCERQILDKFLLTVLDRAWHTKCVACSDCGATLTDKCFSREGQLYCRDDFFRRFGTKCGGCSLGISPNDLVRRARNKVFHLKCFTCMVCRKQLSTGEELYVLDENKFICKDDYLNSKYAGSDHEDDMDLDLDRDLLDSGNLSDKEASLDGDNSMDSSSVSLKETNNNNTSLGSPLPGGGVINSSSNSSNKENTEANPNAGDKKEIDSSYAGSEQENSVGTKRRGPRTTIKAKQLETLKAAFNATPKPTRHIREQLAQETGLNMRVIQVWFQNRRSKERRMKQLSALGARRHFFRNPRRMRALRAGMSPHDLDDSPEMLQSGYNYFTDGQGDFYPPRGYQGYGEFYPGQGEPGFPGLQTGPQGTPPLEGMHPGGNMGPDGGFLHSDMLQTSSPEPLPPMSHNDSMPFNHGPRMAAFPGPGLKSPADMAAESW